MSSIKKYSVVYFIGAFVLCFFTISCEKEPQQFNDYHTIELRQEFSNEWNRWTLKDDSLSGYIKTEFSNSWDRWVIDWGSINGSIRTEFSNSWGRWNFYVNGSIITISTEFSESWNRWRISGNSLEENLFVRTQFSDDNTRWTISTDQKGQVGELKTEFSNDFGRWQLRNNLDQENLKSEEIMAVLFIGVFTAAVYEQEVF